MKYLQKAKSIPEEFKQLEKPDSPKKPKKEEYKDSESESDSEDLLHLKVSTSILSKEKEKIKETLHTGIFTVDKSMKQPDMLKEETSADANEERLHFKESASNVWIEKFLKNNQYDIVEVASNGDCLFDVVRQAFESIGKSTTIQKLRALVANELTDEIYKENRNLYLNFEGEIKEYEMEMKDIEKSLKEYKRRIDKVDTKEEKQHILNEVEVLKKKYVDSKKKKKA
jgi:hypothetical protein